MMTFLLAISILFMSNNHDVPLAIFQMEKKGEVISINITFDTKDFLYSTGMRSENLNSEKVSDYLKKNLQCHFDQVKADFILVRFDVEPEHLKVNLETKHSLKDITKIVVYNTCLINIPNQSNIIQINVNNEIRDFRMHEGRQSIQLVL